ncbi:hypothetical protein [Paenibacillus protaetiae]|uniref:Uncharacterized protein n=1 Tax=Paenibacillus protaetiae TaxID=2509456 RepID=A0A4P6EVC1_9BACL|nr:hypothetical protein [Paenibacillus protaetiae]QAY66123.1 hypothetical protein ET464_06675 [Paenibacillus protaetiae]
MLSKRVLAVVLTVAASVTILFGGWFLYERSVVAAPLQKAINSSDGIVEAGKPDITAGSVKIKVKLAPDANLRSVYETIYKESRDVIGNRELKLDIDQNGSAALDEAWSSALFAVAEAMETKHYSEIPAALSDLSSHHTGIKATSEMDDKNVYITLKQGDLTKYIVLPRTPAQMEAWSNA